jgi:hypothetical protein
MAKKLKQSKKPKQPAEDIPETLEGLPFAPPDTHYLAKRYLVLIPNSDSRVSDRWQLRLYAEKQLEKELGDEVQLTSMKVHRPHLAAKTKAWLQRREPQTRLLVTIKF